MNVPFHQDILSCAATLVEARRSLAAWQGRLASAQSDTEAARQRRVAAEERLAQREVEFALQHDGPAVEPFQEQAELQEIDRELRFLAAKVQGVTAEIGKANEIVTAAADALDAVWKRSGEAALADCLLRWRSAAVALRLVSSEMGALLSDIRFRRMRSRCLRSGAESLRSVHRGRVVFRTCAHAQ